jgi:hypothetical protein
MIVLELPFTTFCNAWSTVPTSVHTPAWMCIGCASLAGGEIETSTVVVVPSELKVAVPICPSPSVGDR